MKPKTLYGEDEVLKVRSVLLPTWQSVMAVSMHAELPHRMVLKILREQAERLRVERRDCRLDGHNTVWMVRLQSHADGGTVWR